jgi:serine/threonine protein kinase
MGAASLEVGDVVGSRYVVEEQVGQGGMAVVYAARHRVTGKRCALKVIHPDLALRDGVIERFLAEAQLAGRIGSHPNVVEIYDAEIDRDRDVPFIAMELLQGKTLAEVIEEYDPLPPRLALDVLQQIADALDAAHASGVVHRDLKPSNVFVVQRGRKAVVKVLDFGIAKVVEGLGAITSTQVGTPAFCAPEQLGSSVRALAKERGFTIASGVAPTTDVYALGFLAWSLLSGLTAEQYWGPSGVGDLLIKVALQPRERPSARLVDDATLPEGFDDWFLVCTAHDAAARWSSAGEAVAALAAALHRPQETPAVAARDPEAPLPRLFDEDVGDDHVTEVLVRSSSASLPAPSVGSAAPGALAGRGSERGPGPNASQPTPFQQVITLAGQISDLRWGALSGQHRVVAGTAAALFAALLLLMLLLPTRPGTPQRLSPGLVVAAVRSLPASDVPPSGASPSGEPSSEEAPEPTDDARGEGHDVAPRTQIARHGAISADSSPASMVFIDGRRRGVTPVTDLKVPPGVHTVQFVREGDRTQQRTVAVAAGQSALVVVTFGDVDFQRDAASSTLTTAAGSASSCRQPEGPTGRGHAHVTFAATGRVTSVRIEPPFAGTTTGRCVEGAFASATVPPFTGSSVTVTRSFFIE